MYSTFKKAEAGELQVSPTCAIQHLSKIDPQTSGTWDSKNYSCIFSQLIFTDTKFSIGETTASLTSSAGKTGWTYTKEWN